MSDKMKVVIAGAVVGLFSVALVFFGNPLNMGFCIACFIRDIAGAVGMHRAGVVQYIRPEIIGLVLGAFMMSVASKEFKARGGSSPFTRFVLGALVMIGALIFLGCPLRMVLRLAGGDLNALVGLFGFIAGIGVGVYFLNKGFNLNRNYEQKKTDGYFLPAIMAGLLVFLIVRPAFIFFSESGPGSMAAPILLALAAGVIVGVLAQKSRLCMVGGIRDNILFKDNHLLIGFVFIFIVALIGNFAFGNFNLGFEGQPVAHTNHVFNFLGLFIVGWGSVLLGGCPMRQLILAGEGNSDSAITVMGMLVGAAISHNFGLAASPAGVSTNGQIAVVVCIIALGVTSLFNSEFIFGGK
jgi:YedE family putative selenium metabolism protein